MSYTITTWTDELGPEEVEVAIEYDFSEAEPEVDYPATLTLCSIRARHGIALDPAELACWASSWLHGRGRDKAVEKARERIRR